RREFAPASLAILTRKSPGSFLQSLEIHAQRHAIGSWHVGQITHASARASLAIERQEGTLVPNIVHERGELPCIGPHAETEIADVITGQLRIVRELSNRGRTEREEARRPRATHTTGRRLLIRQLGVGGPDVLEGEIREAVQRRRKR